MIFKEKNVDMPIFLIIIPLSTV